jgi:biopolymer transport protein ExbD
MRRPLIPQAPVIARINVLPIIDVALVLVVVLLITAPMITVKDLDLTLPEAETRGAEDELRITITLGRDGSLAVDEDLVPFDHLAAALGNRMAEMERTNVLVVLRADTGASYGTIREILREARLSGANRLAIAIRQGGAAVS